MKVREPGDLHFNAMPGRLDKVVPTVAGLRSCLNELGFDFKILKPKLKTPVGLRGEDDYNLGNRITAVARRK